MQQKYIALSAHMRAKSSITKRQQHKKQKQPDTRFSCLLRHQAWKRSACSQRKRYRRCMYVS